MPKVDRSARLSQPVRSATTAEPLLWLAQLSKDRVDAGGSGLRCRLVQGCVERQGHKRLHPGAENPQEESSIRQAPLQTPQPHRDHVRQAQGLATSCNPIRQVPHCLLLGHSPRRNRPLLALKLMSLEPNVGFPLTGWSTEPINNLRPQSQINTTNDIFNPP